MNDLKRSIADTKRISDFFVEIMTADLTDEQAKTRVREPEGASIIWHLGHICQARCEFLKVLDVEVEDTFEPLFERTVAATDGANYPSITELRASWTKLAARVSEEFERATEEQLLKPFEMLDQLLGEQNTLGVLTYILWHEVFHVGEIGTIRTLLGLRPMFDLMAEALGGEG